MSLDVKSGINSIFEVADKEMENFVLLYGHSEPNTWNALAFQVNQINRRTHIIDNLPTLDPGETLSPGYFGESGHSHDATAPGDPITRISSNFGEAVIEYAFSVEPDGVMCWAENPGGSIVTGLQGERLRALGPGKKGAGVWSDWTKTKDGVPTTALSPSPSQGLFRIDSSETARNNIYIGFENKQDTEAPLRVFAVGLMYRVTNVASEETIEDIVFSRRGIKRRVLTWGGMRNDGPNLPKGWETLRLESSEVRTVLGGGEKK